MEDAKFAQLLSLRLRCPVPLIDELLGKSVFYEERRGDFGHAREAAMLLVQRLAFIMTTSESCLVFLHVVLSVNYREISASQAAVWRTLLISPEPRLSCDIAH